MNSTSFPHRRKWISTALPLALGGLLFVWGGCPGPARGETFLLANGGQMEGKLLNVNESPRTTYEIATPGGRLVLPRAAVRQVTVPSERELAYARQAAATPDTAAGHWATAEWCLAQGMARLRTAHLWRVLVHDAQHAPARAALGFVNVGGRWLTVDEMQAGEGLVTHKGEWRLPQEVALEEAAAAGEREQLEWRKKIRLWRSWLGQKRHAEAMAEFRAVRDPAAAAPLIELLERDPLPEARLVACEALATIPAPLARVALAKQAVENADERIREAALDALRGRDDKLLAARQVVSRLADTDNRIVNQAAAVLGALGDAAAVPALIEALTTSHRLAPPSRGGMGISFNSGSGGLSVGAPRPVSREFSNAAVLAALLALVDEKVNFGFQKAEWREWYVRTQTPPNVALRRDE